MNQLDVLSIGLACWYLNFQVDQTPGPNGKTTATALISEGGGPASNAAYCISKLGGKSAFIGRLGHDPFGDAHITELKSVGVQVDRIFRSDTPTSIASIVVNKSGERSVVNYRELTDSVNFNFAGIHTKCILVDGHEWQASERALDKFPEIPSILDAGSYRDATQSLARKVSHVVASTEFATAMSGSEQPDDWLHYLSENTHFVAVTRGALGVVWQTSNGERGQIGAPKVSTIDTTAAGDIFHGAFALALSKGASFPKALTWANEVAALSTTIQGGRSSCPSINRAPNLFMSSPSKNET